MTAPISVSPDGTATTGGPDLTGLVPIRLADDLVMWVDDTAQDPVNDVATDMVATTAPSTGGDQIIRGTVVFTGPRGPLSADWARLIPHHPGVRNAPQ